MSGMMNVNTERSKKLVRMLKMEKEKLRGKRERKCVSGRCQNQSNGCVGCVQMFLMSVTAVGTSRRALCDGNCHFNIILIITIIIITLTALGEQQRRFLMIPLPSVSC